MAVKTFWDHLAEACRDAGTRPLGRDDFDEHTASHVLNELASQQPAVFDLMEARRSQLWSRAHFDDATTVLVMTHKAAEHWQTSQITRAWRHPDFDPSGDPRSHEGLADQFRLAEGISSISCRKRCMGSSRTRRRNIPDGEISNSPSAAKCSRH